MKLVSLDINNNREDIGRLAGDEFLESSFWAELIKSEGESLEIYGAEDKGEIISSALIIKKSLFLNFYYYYVPRGPRGDKKSIAYLLSELKNKKSDAVFIRVEPEENPNIIFENEKNIILKKSLDLQPKKTLMIDLSLSEEEILSAMHQKTRYNIRLAEKKGVEIISSEKNSEADFLEFWRLMDITSERDAFRLHSKEHYKNLLKSDDNIKLFFASYQGKNIATGLFCFYNNRVTYMHGASDNETRNLMAPYLLQFEVIKRAKKEGYKNYDFYGIDENKWPGVTRFKLGFGGFIKEYPGTYDLILRPIIYNLYEFLRRIRRALKFIKK
ncbi:MAG: lipid II:glycine glycyltransferase FemX [Patescibacteria group bacterium]